MLTGDEVNRVWQRMYAAEVRSLYFGDLASTYTTRKQLITGISFFLSSGAAVTVAAHMPTWIPLLTAALSAAATAYSIAVGLDRKAAAMSKLQYQWSQIAPDLERLWNHWYQDDAESQLHDILKRSREASQLGSTDAPYDERRMDKWQGRVSLLHGATSTT